RRRPMTAADVNVTEKVAREAARRFQADRSPSDTVDRDRSVFAEGASFALAALRSPEVVAGIAGVLDEHRHDVTSYDAWHLNGCDCGWTPPDRYSDDAWDQHRAHQARAVAECLAGGD